MSSALFDAEYITRLERLSIAVKRSLSELTAGIHATSQRGFGIEFEDFRTYAPGDDLRYVDWNIYGRLDALFTKQYRQEKQIHLTILLDQSASMAAGRPDKFHTGRRIAAALGYIALASFDRISLYLYGQTMGDHTHLSGKSMGPALFRFLTNAKAGGGTDLSAVCSRLVRRTAGRGIAVVISDCLATPDFSTALRNLKAQRYQVLLLHLTEAEDVHLPSDGAMRLTDAETGATLEVDLTPEILRKYRQAEGARHQKILDACRQQEVAYAHVAADEPFDAVVLKLLQRRRLKR